MPRWNPGPTQTAMHVLAEELAGIRETIRALANAIPKSDGPEDAPPTMALELSGIAFGAVESLDAAVGELREGATITPAGLREEWERSRDKDRLVTALVRARLGIGG
jgi:hypothetical protein